MNALELADALEKDKWHVLAITLQDAAEELRRLHAEVGTLAEKLMICGTDKAGLKAINAELLAALRGMLKEFNEQTITGMVHDEWSAIVKARDVVARAEGGDDAK